MRPIKSRINARETLQDFPFLALKDFSSLFDSIHSKGRLGRREDDPHCLTNEIYIRVLRRLRCAAKRFPRQRTLDLGGLLNQPPEIFYEIVGYLHPVDLWHLSRANKHLRALFSSTTSKWIWNLVFERNPPIPPCPLDMSPLKWADLLFGPARCQRCGTQKVVRPNMNWRRRLCNNCSSDLAEEVFGGYPRKAQIEGDRSESFHDPGIYEDVQIVADTLGAHLINYWGGGSEKIMDLQKDLATKDVVASLYACREKYEAWIEFIKNEDTHESEVQLDAILQIFSEQLRKDGHQEIHVQQFVDSRPIYQIHEMFWRVPPNNRLLRLYERGLRATKRYIRDNWSTQFKTRVEALLYEIASLRTPLLVERGNYIRRMWDDYVTSLDGTSQGAEIPDIVLSEPFATMVNDPSNKPIDEEDITKALAPFANLWLPRTMEDLFTIQHSKSLLDTGDSVHPPHTYSINSAASIFSCQVCEASVDPGPHSTNGYKLIGWNVAVAHLENSFHLHDLADGLPLRINERGCVAARRALELLGLDPETALADDVDKHDARFRCMECEKEYESSVFFSWRECVAHFIELGDQQSHLTPSWRVVSPEGISTTSST